MSLKVNKNKVLNITAICAYILYGNRPISDDPSMHHFKPVKVVKIMHEKHCRIDNTSRNSA